MPNWKKVVTSGSAAELSTLSLTGLSAQNSETDVLTINTSNVIGSRQLGSNAFNSTAFTTNTGTVDTTGTPANNQIAIFTDSNTIEGDANFTWDGNKIFLANGKHIQFTDQQGTFPSSTDSKFKWLLNNDSYEHFAYQPASDQIDVVFKITDNVGSTDRYVFWIDDYKGEKYDAYPLYMDGNNFIVNHKQKYNSGTARSNNVDFYIAASGSTSHTTNPVMKADVSLNRVGIGTNSPDELFDVAGTARFETGVVEGTIYVGDNIQHWGDGGTGVYFDTDEVQIQTDGGTTRATIDADGLDVNGSITVSGTVDGRDIASDGTKLDGIESGATADQDLSTYQLRPSEGAFVNGDKTKLDGIAASANNYVLPTNLAGDDINIDTGALTGATVISDLDFNITTNTSGLVTDANAAVSTRTLTAANLSLGSSDDVTFGSITISTGKIDYGTNTDVDTGTENVATATGAEAAFFDYVVKNSTNIRAGTITAATDGTNVEYNEVSTVDLGSTSDVKLKVVLSSGDLILQATAASDNWNVSSFVRYMAL